MALSAFHSFLTEHDTFQMRHFSGITQFVKYHFVEIHEVDCNIVG